MELDVYLRAIARRWYVIPIFLVIGILSAWGYFQWRSTETAAAKVAVLEPGVTMAFGRGAQAQIDFASVVESRTLADRVADRTGFGLSGQELQGRISARLEPAVIPSIASPLYSVRVQDDDGELAKAIADVVVAEASILFAELNRLESEAVNTAFAGEIAASETSVQTAQQELDNFHSTNKAYALPTLIDNQVTLVNALRQIDILATSSQGGQLTAAQGLAELERLAALSPEYDSLDFERSLAQASVTQLESRLADLQLGGDDVSAQRANAEEALDSARLRLERAQAELATFQRDNGFSPLPTSIGLEPALISALRDSLDIGRTVDVSGSLAVERAELDRLLALRPEYDRLSLDLSQARLVVIDLRGRMQDIIVSSRLPADAQVKLLDPAELQSNALWSMMIYGLSVLIALFFSLSLIYASAYFDRQPESAEEIEILLGVPVLARIPPAR
jgi:capsule polysaccharide export protein KpsE/RkpR